MVKSFHGRVSYNSALNGLKFKLQYGRLLPRIQSTLYHVNVSFFNFQHVILNV